VLSTGDEFLAPAERMLSREPAVFIAGKFDDNDKWMDGWANAAPARTRQRLDHHRAGLSWSGPPGRGRRQTAPFPYDLVASHHW